MRRTFAALLLLVAPSLAHAQDRSLFVGSWRLVSFLTIDSTGREHPYWDEHPVGILQYTAEGLMAGQLYDARRPPLHADWTAASPAAARAAFVELVAYFGTFSVDTVAKTVTHHLQGAMAPDWIGLDFVRAYRFLTPDQLQLRVVPQSPGSQSVRGTVLTWARISH